MPKQDEITSTEKLLDAIRSPETPSAEPEKDIEPAPARRSKRKKPSKGKIISLKKGVNIGVDLGHDALRLVKVRMISENRSEMLDYQNLPYPAEIHKGSPQFAKFLRKSLQQFNGSLKNVSVWSAVPAANVDIYNIRIPKVSKGQIANAVYWTVKKENPFDEGENFLDFQVQKEVMEEGLAKLAVLVYVAPKNEVADIKALFSKAGIQLEGISISPFAIQNLFKAGWLETGLGAVGSLYIGRDWSRIDIFSEGALVLSRDIKAGLNSLVLGFMEAYNEKIAAEPSIELSVQEDEFSLGDLGEEADSESGLDDGGVSSAPQSAPRTPLSFHEAMQLVERLSPDAPPSSEPVTVSDLTDGEILQMMGPALDRLIRQVDRTFEHYKSVLGNEPVEKIFIAGGIEGYLPLYEYVGDQLAIERAVFDPMDTENPFLGLKLPPRSLADRVKYTVAAGLALSNNERTPNLILTQDEKASIEKGNRLKRGITYAFIVIILAFFGYYHFWQGQIKSQKEDQVAAINAQLSQYDREVDQALVNQMVTKLKRRNIEIREYVKRYKQIAMINELSKRTPSNIRLIDVTGDFKLEDVDKPVVKGQNVAAEDKVKEIAIEGYVFDNPETFDQSLTAYVLKLGGSPIFERPVVTKTKIEKTIKGDALVFGLKLDFEG